MATGRSDYPNQINNVLCFPGIFRGVLDVRASRTTETTEVAASRPPASAKTDYEPGPEYVIPGVFTRDVAPAVAAAVAESAIAEGVARQGARRYFRSRAGRSCGLLHPQR